MLSGIALGLTASLAAAEGPRLTGLARQQGVDAAWIWFPNTATSLVLRAGEAQSGYRLLEVDHAHGAIRLETAAGPLVIRFDASVETAARPAVPPVAAVSQRASQNAARAMGLSPEDVPETDGPPPTIDEIAAHARRRLQSGSAPAQ
jgi:hypothetical protein